jgi:16S rRNA (guanine527-N7)-methyltransferase
VIDALLQAAGRHVSRETFEKLRAYEAMLREENVRQNLISQSTLGSFWQRHILDSAQLLRFEPRRGASWADLGSGAGLPGIVIACLVEGPVTLVEPRRLRVDFLHRVAESLGLRATIVGSKAERVRGSYDVITARAVTNLSKLFEISAHLSTTNTVWAFPKGTRGQEELSEARRSWQGTFHVEQSVTDPDSQLVVATGVRSRKR